MSIYREMTHNII